MIQPVNGLSPAAGAQDPFQVFSKEFDTALPAQPQALGPMDATENPSFGDLLHQALSSVQAESDKAEQLTFDFATGKNVDVHTMMIQVAKADTFMQVTNTVVSKVASGLNTLLQTQV